MTELDASKLDAISQYKLLIGSVTPRPIALVTTLGASGPNAAAFSFFNAVGIDPPMLMFSVGMHPDREKDTVQNIRECPEFVVHIVSDAIREQMNICGTEFPRGVNEIAEAGFTSVPSSMVRPPRIAESPIAFECRLMQMLNIGRQPDHMIIGEVVCFHYHEGIVDERFHVDVAKVDAIVRMAGPGGYVRTTDRFEMPRLKYRPGGT